MGFLDSASSSSVWRGYDYYKDNKVKNLIETQEFCYEALVSGNAAEPYKVEIDVRHPKKSLCTCPHAEGKRIVCKHKVATYFAVFPIEAVRFYREYLETVEEEEQREEEIAYRLVEYVKTMKKSELQQVLLQLLFDGPEWQYDNFLRQFDLDKY